VSDTHNQDQVPGSDERDLLISQLQTEKQSLGEELELMKARFKKLLELLSDTQRKLFLDLLKMKFHEMIFLKGFLKFFWLFLLVNI